MAQISNSGIIVLCIVAAGVVVLIGWAITHRIRNGGEDDDERAIYAAETSTSAAPSQFAYMAKVRDKYREEIMSRYGQRQQQQRPQRSRQPSFPMSGAPTSGPSDYSYY